MMNKNEKLEEDKKRKRNGKSKEEKDTKEREVDARKKEEKEKSIEDKKKELKEVLIENAKEYYKNALDAEAKGDFNTTVTLFFKAIASLCDLYIFVKEDKIPSSHTERFRILKIKYKEVYRILDKDFPFYQDSYRTRLNKESSDMLKNDAKILSKLLNIDM